MYGSLDISTSGMVAQRTRLSTIAANIANSNTILNSRGEADPYRRRVVHFAPGDPSASARDARTLGVHVHEIEVDEHAVRLRHEPGNPHADARGYVAYPDINTVREQVDALEASRAYEANVAAAETGKRMFAHILRLLG